MPANQTDLLKVSSRTTCRVCHSPDLVSIFSLGNLYVSNFVDTVDTKAIKAPLELVYCEKCTLVQLKDTAPQELLYARSYWYRSGLNPVITSDLKEITEVVRHTVKLKQGDIVLDIGANDGSMLQHYPETLVRVGCEPARNLVSYLRKVTPWVINDFWSYKAWRRRFGAKKAKAITAIGMFYDMEDPNQFIRDAAKALDKNGVFIAQLMCLEPMLQKNDLGNICHEHLEYYSYASLKYLFESNGLEIFRVEENSINGGSYRLFARHLKSGSVEHKEHCTKQDLLDFRDRINRNRRATMEFVRSEVARGKKVYAYGASTKGNTILQYFGLDAKLLAGAADKDPRKWGKLTIGTWVPIVNEDEARKNADYFLVLPWAFWRSFHAREQPWLKNGGRFVLPLPEFQVVNAAGKVVAGLEPATR